MDWELIWEKIQEYAIMFYNFAMTEGENRFMLVDRNFINGYNVPEQMRHFFIGSFVVMILLAIFACDSFRLFHPIVGIGEWKSKISIVKVIIFAAAVFSFHTFYKMLIALSGKAIHADASAAALDCLGSYINPISLMVYAFAVSTMSFRKGPFQALFLGWAIFLTPAVMSFSTITNEHIMLYIVTALFGIAGAFCYRRCSPYAACFVMYITYFITKFFMIYYSEEVLLLTADSWNGKFGQYMACMQMDAILCFILLLMLFGYKGFTTERKYLKIKKDLILTCIVTIFMVGTIASNYVIEVHAIPLVKFEPAYYIEDEEYEDVAAEEDSDEQELSLFIIIVESANVRSGPSTDYDVLTTVSRGTEFYGTGNEETADNGRTWYEIYIDAEQSQTGWASEIVIKKQ